VIADRPSDVGSDHASATVCDDGVAVSASGTEGTVAGAIVVVGAGAAVVVVVGAGAVVVVGAGVGAGSNDAEYANLFGEPRPTLVIASRVAELISAVVTAAGVADVRVSKYTAAIPATNGDAIEVPDNVAAAVVEPVYADGMLVPGAKMSTHVPKFEKDERVSFNGTVAPTVIADGALDGE
jgi:hypothetical protein